MKLRTFSRWPNRFLAFAVASIMVSSQVFAQAASPKSLEEIIRLASEKSESFQAIDQSIKALEAEIRSRDLELSAFLTTDLHDTRDERLSLSNQTSIGHRQFFETTLEKPFSTGTNVSLLLGHQIADLAAFGDNSHVANWEVTVSQDLWQNAFGRATRLRRQSDSAEFKSRQFEAYGQKQQLLITLEKVYWDLALALKEEQIRIANFQRTESLDKYIRARVRKFAAESTDLLQVEALLSQRKLELLENRNRISELKNQIRQLIPVAEVENLQPDLASLESSRSPQSLLALAAPATSSKPQSLSALSSFYKYNQAKAEAARTEDTLRPSLQAYVSHGRNGIEDSASRAWDRARTDDYTATTLGLRLSMELDSDLKTDRKRAAQLTAESRALEAKAESRKADLGWTDLERQIQSLKSRTEEAAKLSKFQMQKANEENRRYRQGRTTAFQAITFETDAATAELTLYQLFANLRKLESLARAFAYSEEVSL
jgi:outer membrane protein TolC